MPMYRDSLLREVKEYAQRHPDEAECAQRFQTLLESRKDCFLRTCPRGHVTASAWIVSHDGQRSVLTHHRKLGRWIQAGGHCDGDPEPWRIAIREAQEETGLWDLRGVLCDGRMQPIDLDVHAIPAVDGDPAHEHFDVRYLLVAAPGQTLRASPESHEVRWVGWDELTGLTTEESVLRLAAKARAAWTAAQVGS